MTRHERKALNRQITAQTNAALRRADTASTERTLAALLRLDEQAAGGAR